MNGVVRSSNTFCNDGTSALQAKLPSRCIQKVPPWQQIPLRLVPRRLHPPLMVAAAFPLVRRPLPQPFPSMAQRLLLEHRLLPRRLVFPLGAAVQALVHQMLLLVLPRVLEMVGGFLLVMVRRLPPAHRPLPRHLVLLLVVLRRLLPRHLVLLLEAARRLQLPGPNRSLTMFAGRSYKLGLSMRSSKRFGTTP